MPGRIYNAVSLNFKLNPEGKAVDAEVVFPNLNDNLNGKASDLGALGVGGPEVIYGTP